MVFLLCLNLKGGVNMAKRPSLGHQFHQVLQRKKAIGQSRHEAKERGVAHEGIYSYKTYDAYKNASKQFVKWIKSEFPEIKHLSEIDKDICKKYIKYREQSDISLTKKECEVATRKLSNIKKNRIDNGFKTESGAIESILRGTGLRRNELVNLKVGNLVVQDNKVVGVLVRRGAKGGKTREVQVLKKYQNCIYELVKGLDSNSKVINEEIPKELQAHRYRAKYAQNMYKELIELGREDPAKDLTECMGHNRKSILIYYGVDIKK